MKLQKALRGICKAHKLKYKPKGTKILVYDKWSCVVCHVYDKDTHGLTKVRTIRKILNTDINYLNVDIGEDLHTDRLTYKGLENIILLSLELYPIE